MSGASHLSLSLVRAPAGISAESRTLVAGRFAVGRGADNDWILPDPDHCLSKRHCAFELREKAWFVVDTSSNGTSLNGKPLEPQIPQLLHDGDQLAFGPYEIKARFEAAPDWTGPDRELTDDRLTSDPFSPDKGDALGVAHPAVGLPNDFDPLVLGDGIAPCSDIISDHVPDLNQNFRPPRSSFEVLPEDWDEVAAPATPPVPAPLPARPDLAPPSQPDGAGTISAGFAAFVAGAGLPGAAASDPDATLQALGAAFRALVAGLRQILATRATIKGEFRIEQTMIRAWGNNPLKFSADDNDALSALLGAGRQTGMAPRQAIAESLRDMRLHDLAVASAMQRAVCDLLRELDPDPVMQEVRGGRISNLLGSQKRRAWDEHCRRYARLVAALSDDFDNAFRKSFARAYEAALAEIAAREPS